MYDHAQGTGNIANGGISILCLGKDPPGRSKPCGGGAGSLRERPSSAWWDNLRELMGHPIPWPDLREKFDRIGERLMPEISSAPDAMHKMRDGELTEIAGEIVDLYDTLCAHTARTSEDTAARPAVWLGDARQSR